MNASFLATHRVPVTLCRILSMGLLSFIVGCFTSEKSGPFEKKDGAWWYQGTRIDGADVATFQGLDKHYAKDKARVYHADTYRDGKEYWLVKHVRVRELDSAHVLTFEVLKYDYARDRERVWYEGRECLLIKDAASFSVIDARWTHDAVHGYFDCLPVEGSDGQSFARLGDRHARDASHVWYCRTPMGEGLRALPKCTRLDGADAASFVALDGEYARDAQKGWHGPRVLRDAKGASLQTLDQYYATDGTRIWYEGAPVEGDAATFQLAGEMLDRGVDARDKDGWFRYGKRATPRSADSAEVEEDSTR